MFTATLPKNAQRALAILGKNNILPTGTYLAGGSGLALSLNHRVSVDFDFFTPNSFDQKELTKNLSKIGQFTFVREAKDTLLGTFEKTKFSIFTYRHKLIFKPIQLDGVSIADPKDIAAMKIDAVSNRGSKKDFIDLYFLSHEGISLENCLELYEKKYHLLANNIYTILTALSYFNDAEESEMPKMLKTVSWKDVKIFFERESIRLAKKHL